MAYYYVKNGGTKTTGSTTKQSGSFATLGAANYYDNIAAAITGGATSGDIICVSDAHAFSSAALITYSGPTAGDYLYVVTVSDTNCDQQADVPASPQEQAISAADWTPTGRISFHGFNFKTVDNINNGARQLLFHDSIIELTDDWSTSSDGSFHILYNTTLKYVDTGSKLLVNNGSTFKAYGGSTNATAVFTSGGFGNGGGTIELVGFDLSTITGTVFDAVGNSASADDTIDIKVIGCKTNASAVWFDETLANLSMRLEVSNSAPTSDAAEHQFYVEAYGGNVEDQDDTGIHRDETTAFPSGTQISLKCTTDANATPSAPFWFDFPTRYAALSAAASDVLTIHLAVVNTTTLYDSDVWVELLYPDGTNKHLYNFLSTRHTDIMDTNGTVLDTDTGSTWKSGASDLTGYNEYKIDIDTSSDAGADCVPIIRVYVAKASTTIYFCPTVEAS